MPDRDWKIFNGKRKPHDEVLQFLENDKLCPQWRNFPQRFREDNPDAEHRIKALRQEPDETDDRGKKFLATSDMVEMVNAALYIRRPLLITGKPGTGKSSLIYSVAYELKLGKVLRWPITTRSTLKDALYQYDAIGRLQEADLIRLRGETSIPDIGKYLRLGPLGTALLPSRRPRALLIDEIDKSDVDLPNDLLNIFEEGEYEIPELVRLKEQEREIKLRPYDAQDPVTIIEGRVRCFHFPFIVMTSNGEREFPTPFLRRCIRLEIQQEDSVFQEIVAEHLGAEVIEEAQPIITNFLNCREEQDLATDQLLNIIFLITRDNGPGDAQERKRLIKALLKELKPAETI